MLNLKSTKKISTRFVLIMLVIGASFSLVNAQSDNMVIEKTDINSKESYSANSITIGPNVTVEKTGDLILHSNTLAIKPQFFVLNGGQLNVVKGSIALGLEEQRQILFPGDFKVSQNYPNPFNPQTTIRYTLVSACHVRISIYDINGQEVATLVNKNQSAGGYNVTFNARGLSSGFYFYRVSAGTENRVMKMTLLK